MSSKPGYKEPRSPRAVLLELSKTGKYDSRYEALPLLGLDVPAPAG